jgi:hypothetical protein
MTAKRIRMRAVIFTVAVEVLVRVAQTETVACSYT